MNTIESSYHPVALSHEQSVLLAVDADNLFINRPHGTKVHYGALLKFAEQFGRMRGSNIYAASPHPQHLDNLAHRLRQVGFSTAQMCQCRVHSNQRYKSDVDTRITIDLVCAANTQQIDTVILASGDSDFLPLVEYLHCQHIKVIVIGPDEATASEMKVKSDAFFHTSEIAGLHMTV